MAIMVGCVTFTSATGKALQSTAVIADEAMKAYAVEVVKGDVDPDTQLRVRYLHAGFIKAHDLAEDAYVLFSRKELDKASVDKAMNKVFITLGRLTNTTQRINR